MDIDGRQDPTPEPGPDPMRCPSCRAPYRSPLDQRYGYCWEEHEFMGEPEDFVALDDTQFSDRVRDKVAHMPPRDYPVMTDEEREQMWQRNRDAYREEERYALRMIESTILPGGTSLIGSFDRGAMLYDKDPTWWQRLRARLRLPRPPVRIDEHERITLTIGLSPGARLLSGQDAVDHLMRPPRPRTRRERLRARLSARR